VNEHRLTLGDWERSQILPITNEIQQLLKTGRIVSQTGAVVTGTAAVAVGAGVLLAGYGAYAWLVEDGVLTKAWKAVKDTWDSAKQTFWDRVDDTIIPAAGGGTGFREKAAADYLEDQTEAAITQNPDTGEHELDTSELNWGSGSWG
jgi:hypothetical protein